MKFADAFEKQLSEAIALGHRVLRLSNNCGKHLSEVSEKREHQRNQFLNTAINFTRINCDAIDCIESTIKAGHIAESVVLMRWHLEIAHLFYYLCKNDSEYEEWLDGKEIRPQVIGEFFKKNELASWKDTYVDLSYFTHGNSQYVENCWNYSKARPIDDRLIILASNVLRNVMFKGHFINMVSGSLLKGEIGVGEYNKVKGQYNALDKDIFAFSDKHNKMENDALIR